MKPGDLVKNRLHNAYGLGFVSRIIQWGDAARFSGPTRSKFEVLWQNKTPVHPNCMGIHWEVDLMVINEGR